MKEHSIIFSGPMVRAILDGRKTMTRRVMRTQPSEDWSPVEYGMLQRMVNGEPTEPDPKRDRWGVVNEDGDEGHFAPYGPVGDRLWVRETWRNLGGQCARYKADDGDGGNVTWKPSIFMPRWASRITLEVTGVRVERLQEITGNDIAAEGYWSRDNASLTGRDWFRELWDSLNAKRGFGWDANPWAWVYEFKVVKP